MVKIFLTCQGEAITQSTVFGPPTVKRIIIYYVKEEVVRGWLAGEASVTGEIFACLRSFETTVARKSH